MEGFMRMLLSLTLSGTGLGLAVMLLARFGKKHLSSSFIYLCWALVLLRLILPLPGIIGLRVSDAPAAERAAAARTSSGTTSYYSSPLSRTEGALTRESADKNARAAMADTRNKTGETVISVQPAVGTGVTESQRQTDVPVYQSWSFWFYLWLCGAVVSFGGTVISFRRFRRILFRTLKPARPLDSSVLSALNASPYPALYRSDKVSTTLLLGLIRPVIVLPDGDYSSETLDRMLLHELTHYRRGDLAIKWLQMLVFSIHWFNPLVYLFRAQTALYCELSCDQRLIRRMNRNDKQSYGEMLLNLAAERALPRRVIAVSFTTEKRDLKERLVQIMNFKKAGKQALALSMAALMMMLGCAYVLGPAQASSSENSSSAIVTDEAREEYRVSNVDELLDALGSNRTVVLTAGEYDLTRSKGYGRSQSEAYYWQNIDDDYQLVLDAVSGLALVGEGGAEQVSIITEPRSAAVLRMQGCLDISLTGITAGHTVLPEYCRGAVVEMYACSNVNIDSCVLYGCGTVGVSADECWKLSVTNSTVRECSMSAVCVANSFDVTFDKCEFHDCRTRDGGSLWTLIEADNVTALGIYNTVMYNNYADTFVYSSNSHYFEIAGCRVTDNVFGVGIASYGDVLILDGNEFSANTVTTSEWFSGENTFANDRRGGYVTEKELENMQWAEFSYTGHSVSSAGKPEGRKLENGMTEYRVNTADELLACLGSDTVIVLEADRYDLSGAEAYGGRGSESYYWMQCYDGYGPVLVGIKNMKIVAAGEKARIELLPRSADVMTFKYCENITLDSVILGHTTGMGSCMGDVVSFMACSDCSIVNAELFGCGVDGVSAYACRNISVQDSRIYECSGYAGVITDCANTQFKNVTVYDCGNNSVLTQRCSVLFSGETYYTDDYYSKAYSMDYDYSGYDYFDYGEEVDIEFNGDIQGDL